jgi:hypothetical protein
LAASLVLRAAQPASTLRPALRFASKNRGKRLNWCPILLK